MYLDWHTILFWIFALLAVVFASGVVLMRRVVHMAVCLVGCLGVVAGLYFLAGAGFLAALQLLVYVGGTMVLLVFGVMLTRPAMEERLRIPLWQLLLSTLTVGCLLALLVVAARRTQNWVARTTGVLQTQAQTTATTELGLALLGVRDCELEAQQTGKLVAGYLLPFEIVSVHLLVVLIAAAYLARPRRPKVAIESVLEPQDREQAQ